jgi:hypothetical protein
MKGNFKVKLVHFLGWILFIISLCVVIAGLFANKGEALEFGIIGFFIVFGAFGFFLTRYKKGKKAELSENEEKQKKTLSEKLQEQKEKSIQKQKELQEQIDTLKKQKEQNTRIKTLEQMITKYQKSYYNGEAEISDGEFDLLWDELKAISPDSPVLKKIGNETAVDKPKIKNKKKRPPPDEELPEDSAYRETLEHRKEEGSVYHIEYIDSEGKKSSRDIEIIRFEKSDDRLYIYAYCHLAKAVRQFLVDRIVSISLWDQPIENPQRFLRDKYKRSAG